MKTLSTGDIAKLCDVNLRTVIRWIERGSLKGFKLPGRGNNRVRVEDFIAFLIDHDIPIPPELMGDKNRNVVIADPDNKAARAIQRVLRSHGYATYIAQDAFQAGVLMVKVRPFLLVLDAPALGVEDEQFFKFLRATPEISITKLAVVSEASSDQLLKMKALGAQAVLEKPFENDQLLDCLSSIIEPAPGF